MSPANIKDKDKDKDKDKFRKHGRRNGWVRLTSPNRMLLSCPFLVCGRRTIKGGGKSLEKDTDGRETCCLHHHITLFYCLAFLPLDSVCSSASWLKPVFGGDVKPTAIRSFCAGLAWEPLSPLLRALWWCHRPELMHRVLACIAWRHCTMHLPSCKGEERERQWTAQGATSVACMVETTLRGFSAPPKASWCGRRRRRTSTAWWWWWCTADQGRCLWSSQCERTFASTLLRKAHKVAVLHGKSGNCVHHCQPPLRGGSSSSLAPSTSFITMSTSSYCHDDHQHHCHRPSARIGLVLYWQGALLCHIPSLAALHCSVSSAGSFTGCKAFVRPW